MATIKFTNSKSSIKKIYNYITQKSKTTDNLISTKDCLKFSAIEEMLLTKNQFNKNTGRQYIHIVQSFDPKDNLSYEQANAIGLKLAEYFNGFQAVVSTHTDKKHIHNHILLNSVNFNTGYKFQQSKNDMQDVKNYSDKLCLQYGLSIIENPSQKGYMKQNEYQVAIKGQSWKIELIIAIDKALSVSTSKLDFINNMELQGYKVNWTDKRKYITFTTPLGKKCRDNKLIDKKYSKEVLEREFRNIETKSLDYKSTTRGETNRINEIGKSNSTSIQYNYNGGMGQPNKSFRTYRKRDKNSTYREVGTFENNVECQQIQQRKNNTRNNSISTEFTNEYEKTRFYDNRQSNLNKKSNIGDRRKSESFDRCR